MQKNLFLAAYAVLAAGFSGTFNRLREKRPQPQGRREIAKEMREKRADRVHARHTVKRAALLNSSLMGNAIHRHRQKCRETLGRRPSYFEAGRVVRAELAKKGGAA